MRSDAIAKVTIDGKGRLRVYPESPDPYLYKFVYRSACEVHWDPEGYFYSPKPREWSYARWFSQIVGAVKSELGVDLRVSTRTIFLKVPHTEREAMVSSHERFP